MTAERVIDLVVAAMVLIVVLAKVYGASLIDALFVVLHA